MKKIIFIVALLLGVTTFSFSQTSPSPKDKSKKTETVKPGAPKKKDGTPDMRYSANKKAVDTTQKLKKDGTPDKRFKTNKKKN